jgi:hypothetical protein
LKRQLLITFDYELFLGKRSGTVQQCLIKPSRLILEVLEKHNVKHALFFVDTTYLLRLKQQQNEKCKSDFLLITEQLKQILKKGHYLFPHLHPHWLDAKYNEGLNQWDLSDINRYRLHKLSSAEARNLFNESFALLSEIYESAGVLPQMDSYRAGGWCIQPFSFFEPVFRQLGIVNDFSVLKGIKNTNDLCSYDFTAAPPENIYKFTNDVNIKDPKGHFTEFAISSIHMAPLTKWFNKLLLKYLSITKNHNLGDGISNDLSAGAIHRQNDNEMIAIELLTKAKLKTYLNFMTENNYMHFISHPKMLSKHNIETFDTFLEKVKRRYDVITDYKKMID